MSIEQKNHPEQAAAVVLPPPIPVVGAVTKSATSVLTPLPPTALGAQLMAEAIDRRMGEDNFLRIAKRVIQELERADGGDMSLESRQRRITEAVRQYIAVNILASEEPASPHHVDPGSPSKKVEAPSLFGPGNADDAATILCFLSNKGGTATYDQMHNMKFANKKQKLGDVLESLKQRGLIQQNRPSLYQLNLSDQMRLTKMALNRSIRGHDFLNAVREAQKAGARA